MFAKPRPKKSPLPPPSKKRKRTYGIEEISFDNAARHEYLTGFHKRKQQRIKQAQEEAAKKARQERLETRKQLREERRREVEQHVESVNKILRESGEIEGDIEKESEDETDEEWDGFPDRPDLEIVDHEEEYIDEDRYTTVTVETVSVSRDGLEKPGILGEETEVDQNEGQDKDGKDATTKPADPAKPKKKKKPKFRYESKIERQLTERKQKAKNKSRREK